MKREVQQELFARAKTRRERGMVSSLLHAERGSEGWSDRAFAKLCQFSAIKRKPWTIEQFRWWAREHGLDDPPELRAFGGVTRRAINRNVIRVISYQPVAASNGSRKAAYLSQTSMEPPDA
jgi:hypothetical protein